MRKGQRYGTILIDHEPGHVVDLLPDRTPETLAQWLRDHSGVEIVTRDRAEAYAQGITHDAPDALQIADRWHLIKNLTDALTLVLQDHRRAMEQHLAQSAGQHAPPAVAPSHSISHTHTPHAKTPTVADQQRQARAEQAHRLHERGWSNKRIAQHLHCHPKTIHRYLKRQRPLAVGRAGRQRKLDPYTPYLLKRWNEGCHTAAQLYRALQPQGCDGGCTILRAFIADVRVPSGVPARSRTGSGTPLPSLPKRMPSSRMLAWLSTQPAASLNDEQRALGTK
jgi:AraC-like DNA-binding protein